MPFLLALGYPAARPLRPIAKPDRQPFGDVVQRGRWGTAWDVDVDAV